MSMHAERIAREDQWQQLLASSAKQPVLLFKHSATCPISEAAKEAFDAFLSQSQPGGFQAAYLIVQEDRPVSNAVEEQLRVKHESPQAIVINDEKAVWQASHWDITVERLVDALAAV